MRLRILNKELGDIQRSTWKHRNGFQEMRRVNEYFGGRWMKRDSTMDADFIRYV